jgi:DNA repair photolyase
MACGNCSSCGDRLYCAPFKDDTRDYEGVRFTADCFDCAIQLSIDTYSSCSFDCLYCFSNYLVRNPETQAKMGNAKAMGVLSPRALENILDLDRAGDGTGMTETFRKYIRRPGGHRSVVQWGALGDPFDNIERWNGTGLKFIELFQRYEQPVRVSTKGGLLLQEPRYLHAIGQRPQGFWFAFSIISIDDDVLEAMDRRAPNATQRLRAMKLLTDMGCRATVRIRPILKNVTDATAKHPQAWKELLYRARESGAEAVSMEFVFVPGATAGGVGKRWRMIEEQTRFPYRRFYKSTSDRYTSCLRSSATWKEELVFLMRDEAHRLGMVFSISDPHWKELNDTGCCCGIKPDDPIFGYWERKQACQGLLDAKADYEAGGQGLIRLDQVTPEWAHHIPGSAPFFVTGARCAAMNRLSFAECHHKHIWNNPDATRGPYLYFGGVLQPTSLRDADGNLVYHYVPRERRGERFGWGEFSGVPASRVP